MRFVSLALCLFLAAPAFAEPRIIFPGEDGKLIIVMPITGNNFINETTGQWLPLPMGEAPPAGYRQATVEDIAKKDVPAGKPYKIIDSSEIPTVDQDSYDYDKGLIIQNPAKLKEVKKAKLPEELRNIFETLPNEMQAALAPLKAAVKDELELGHYDVVKAIIEGAEIPAELEPLRQQMLERFK